MVVQAWGYRCELTVPQIEIMQSDLPHTLIISKEETKSKIDTADYDEATRLNEMALQRALERRQAEKDRQRQHTVDDIFNGSIED